MCIIRKIKQGGQSKFYKQTNTAILPSPVYQFSRNDEV